MRTTLTTCSDCGRPLEPHAIFWRWLGSERPEPFCDACACWLSQSFNVTAVLLEARMIVSQAHQRLNAIGGAQ